MADGRHLQNRYDVITSATDDPIPMKFGVPMENHMPMTVKRSKSKPEAEFQHGGLCIHKPGVVIARPWIETSGRNLVGRKF